MSGTSHLWFFAVSLQVVYKCNAIFKLFDLITRQLIYLRYSILATHIVKVKYFKFPLILASCSKNCIPGVCVRSVVEHAAANEIILKATLLFRSIDNLSNHTKAIRRILCWGVSASVLGICFARMRKTIPSSM